MWWFKNLKLRRMKRELNALLLRDRAMRTVPGATTADLPDKMVALGHKIAVLRFELAQLEEDDPCDTYPS